MSEKVLGLKNIEEFLDNWCGRYTRKELPKEVVNFLEEEKDKIVPVVSVEWLEKWCKENSWREHYTAPDEMEGWKKIVEVNDLLKAARRQAENSEAKK